MKLYMILYVSNAIGGTWGPLPYEMAECQARAIEGNAVFQANDKTKDWLAVCEFRETRPKLGEVKS